MNFKSLSKIIDNSALDLFQLLKLLVYFLLLINFVLYVRLDWEIASYTMRNGGSLLDWTRAFATTIDESAWIILIILFELETYVLSDDFFSGLRAKLLHGVRYICYGFLVHSLYAFGIYVYELSVATAIADISDLCQLAGEGISFATNLVYTDLDPANCAILSNASQFFYTDPPEFIIVTDEPGLVIELQLAWVDFLEVVVWLAILFTIELGIRLQDRSITRGMLIKALTWAKIMLYTLLWGGIFYWLYRGHFMFAWDEFVWIAGFVAIESNMAIWRQEIDEADGVNTAPADPI